MYKNEDPVQIPSTHAKNQPSGTHRGGEDQTALGDLWPASLDKSMSFRFTESACLKTQEQLKRMPGADLWLTHLCVSSFTHTCTQTRVNTPSHHTHINKMKQKHTTFLHSVSYLPSLGCAVCFSLNFSSIEVG